MEAELLTLLSGSADAVIVVIGVILLRMERRTTRLELKVFGFDLGNSDRRAE